METTWTDEVGIKRDVPSQGKLKFTNSETQSLRAFIHHRAAFTCRHCGTSVQNKPEVYDGSYAFHWMRPVGDPPRVRAYAINGVTHLMDGFVVDHIIPWREGGSNHPDNLQLLCDKCNKRKRRYERLWLENGKVGTPNDFIEMAGI